MGVSGPSLLIESTDYDNVCRKQILSYPGSQGGGAWVRLVLSRLIAVILNLFSFLVAISCFIQSLLTE